MPKRFNKEKLSCLQWSNIMKPFYSSPIQGKFNFFKLQINEFLPEMYLRQRKRLLKLNFESFTTSQKWDYGGTQKPGAMSNQDSIRDLLNKLWLCTTEYVGKYKSYLDRSRLAISGSPEGNSINQQIVVPQDQCTLWNCKQKARRQTCFSVAFPEELLLMDFFISDNFFKKFRKNWDFVTFVVASTTGSVRKVSVGKTKRLLYFPAQLFSHSFFLNLSL